MEKEQGTGKRSKDWQTGAGSRKNRGELALWLQAYLRSTLKA